MKKYLTVSILALAVLGITARAFCYPADVIDISGNKYFPAVKEAIAKARKSINVLMFIIESLENRGNSKASQLIGALIEAKNRGVEVEVILDQDMGLLKSVNAYERLKEAGIKIYYDDPARYLHAKTIIIDKKIVILGSTNWSAAAFDSNIETDVLVNSGRLAQEILSYLKTIKIDEEAGKYVDSIGPSTPISRGFLENPRIAAFMVKEQAERAFDVYLYLLWKNRGSTFRGQSLFYDDLAKYLGIYEGWTSEAYRRQIIKVLRKLEEKYELIKFEPRYGEEGIVTLLCYKEIASPATELRRARNDGVSNDDESYFNLPNAYFEYGWNRQLSLRAKFCYLVNLGFSDASQIKPYWSKSVAAIARQCGGVSEGVINKGMGELRRQKLLEVRYDELSGKPYEERRPKMYKLLRLYDPKVRESRLKDIEDKYGKEAYTKARKYAEIVFEENSPEVIEDIVLKTKEYGETEIKRAFGEVSRKNTDNPKRNYLYVTRILGRTEDIHP